MRRLSFDRALSIGIALAGLVVFVAVCLFMVDAYHESLMAPLQEFPNLLSHSYFDIQGYGLTIGHLNAPCRSLGWEAFYINGRCYGYMGLTPSFIRIILNSVMPQYFGLWSRVVMIVAALFMYIDGILIARFALKAMPEGPRKQAWVTGFALILCLGGPTLYMVSDPGTYTEPIIWAAAFALLSYWALLAYDDTRRQRYLWLAIASTFFALHSRLTIGLGVSVALMLALLSPFAETWRPMRGIAPAGWAVLSRRRSVIAMVIVVVATATPMAVNYAKFGGLSLPMARQPFFAFMPARLERVKDGMFQLRNVPCNLALYFSFPTFAISGEFPWMVPIQGQWWHAGEPLPPSRPRICADSNLEHIDVTYSLIEAAPAPLLMLLASVPIFWARRRSVGRRWAPPLIGAVLGCSFLLPWSSVAYRYMFDFFPLLVLGGAVSWRRLADMRSLPARGIIVFSLTCLVLGGMVANFSMATITVVPQPYMEHLKLDIAGLLSGP